MESLVLSLFPGIDLLGRAFREVGFSVVQGGDVIFGGDIRGEHYPAGRFDGVIGGPPCQAFSQMKHLNKLLGLKVKFGNLIPEFERIIAEVEPAWFLMENVKQAPKPEVDGYMVRSYIVTDWKCGGMTQRQRRFSYGSLTDPLLMIRQNQKAGETKPLRAVTGNCRIPRPEHIEQSKGKGGVFPGQGTLVPLPDMCERQGLPRTFKPEVFTVTALRQAIGNGVPMAMGKAVAAAVAAAAREPRKAE